MKLITGGWDDATNAIADGDLTPLPVSRRSESSRHPPAVKICRDLQEQLVEMNGETEHVHSLTRYPPKHSVSGMVNSLEGVSSRLLRIERPDL